MVVLSLGHGLAELCRVFEHADEDLQTVEVRVLRRDHLENGLMKDKREGACSFCSPLHLSDLSQWAAFGGRF